MSLTLTQAVRNLGDLRNERAALVTRHKAMLKDLDNRIADASRELAMLQRQLDSDAVQIAERLMYVDGRACNQERMRVVKDAIVDVANGAPRLRKRYFATKDYAHWSDQREDHTYGYGPKHGSIVFRIGLTQDVRRLGLSDDEREACLYYLGNIVSIQQAGKAA